MTILITLMMVMIGATSYLQTSSERTFVAFVFSFSLLGFDLVANIVGIDTFWYYIIAGIIDTMVITLISKMDRPCKLAEDILLISLISIFYNFFGWTLFLNGYEDTIYRVMYIALYGWALYVLVREEPKNHGNYKNSSWLHSIRSNADARYQYYLSK